MFDSLKRSAEGVFDAMVTKSQSVASAIGNAFKTAILTAIKEIVTSQVARMLMGLFGGARMGGGMSVAGAGGGGFGMPGILGAALPILGGGGLGGIGMGGGGGIGTPPFMPSGGGAGGSGGGGFGGLGGLMNLAGLKQFFGFGGAGGARLQDSISGGLGSNLSKLGHSNAALMGGATLAMMGLQRGGFSGLGMTTAGGALIGFKYGGAMGAAIGGAIGAVAGTIRLFIKGATEKAKEKIKATYGVEIKDKGVLQQVVDIAKQGYGGNLDMAIGTQQVRDLVELYALSTGQGTRGMPAKMTAGSLVQSGGSLFQGAQYSNGSLLPTSGGLPGARLSGGAVKIHVTSEITLNAPETKTFLEAGVLKKIAANPRVVQSAGMVAQRGNFGRREGTAIALVPVHLPHDTSDERTAGTASLGFRIPGYRCQKHRAIRCRVGFILGH